jgi:CheY-like chemotaxis protein
MFHGFHRLRCSRFKHHDQIVWLVSEIKRNGCCQQDQQNDRFHLVGAISSTKQANTLLGAAYGLRPANSISRIMSTPMKILVVEDEKALGHMIATVLGGPASKVTRAANGWEALMKIGATAKPFDVVITDHRMPRVTGLQLVRRLRAQNFGGKILVLSAHLADEDISAYEELSVDMMMSKPFDFDELQQAMAILNKKASVLAEA